ncbi:hypothetical protein ACFCX0_31045 [Streptomyces sp. NPDC056352]
MCAIVGIPERVSSLGAGYVVVHQLRIDDVGDRDDGCRAPPG